MTARTAEFITQAQHTLGLSDERLALLCGADSGKAVRRWKMDVSANDHRTPNGDAVMVLQEALRRTATGGIVLEVYPDRITALEASTDHPLSNYGLPVLLDGDRIIDGAELLRIASAGGWIEADDPAAILRGLPPPLPTHFKTKTGSPLDVSLQNKNDWPVRQYRRVRRA